MSIENAPVISSPPIAIPRPVVDVDALCIAFATLRISVEHKRSREDVLIFLSIYSHVLFLCIVPFVHKQ